MKTINLNGVEYVEAMNAKISANSLKSQNRKLRQKNAELGTEVANAKKELAELKAKLAELAFDNADPQAEAERMHADAWAKARAEAKAKREAEERAAKETQIMELDTYKGWQALGRQVMAGQKKACGKWENAKFFYHQTQAI